MSKVMNVGVMNVGQSNFLRQYFCVPFVSDNFPTEMIDFCFVCRARTKIVTMYCCKCNNLLMYALDHYRVLGELI